MNSTLDLIQQLKNLGWQCPVVYDIGANKGNWTKYWENILPETTFFMFEANPRMSRPAVNLKHKWFNVVLSDKVGKEVSFYCNNSTGDSYYKENTSYYNDVEPVVMVTDTLANVIRTNNLITLT